jgi:hypothetical protein
MRIGKQPAFSGLLMVIVMMLGSSIVQASGTAVIVDPLWFSSPEMAVATAKGISRVSKSGFGNTKLHFVGMDASKGSLEVLSLDGETPNPGPGFVGKVVTGAKIFDLEKLLKEFSRQRQDLYKSIDHFIIFSPIWSSSRSDWNKRKLNSSSISSLRKASKLIQRNIRKSARKNRTVFATVIVPDESLVPSYGEISSKYDSLEKALRDLEYGQGQRKASDLDPKLATQLIRHKFASMFQDSYGGIYFVSGTPINARDRLSDQFLEILCGQLFLVGEKVNACLGYEKLSVTVRVDFDRGLGLSKRHLQNFSRKMAPFLSSSGPRRTLRAAFLRSRLSDAVAESAEQYESQLLSEHDPNADYHIRVIAGVDDEPFRRPTLFVTAQFSGDVQFRGEHSAPVDNTSYRGMLNWLQRDIAAFVEENVVSDYPVEKRRLTFNLNNKGKQVSANGQTVFSEVRFNSHEWQRFSNGTIRSGKLILDAPIRSNAFRLVLDTEVKAENTGAGHQFRRERHDLPVKLPRLKDDTASVNIPTKLIGHPEFVLPPEEHENLDVGKNFLLLVFKTGTSGRHLVASYPVKLQADGKIIGPDLLPGQYQYELIPEKLGVLADIGTQSGGNNHSGDVIFETDELANRYNNAETDFDGDFNVDEDGDDEQQTLPSSIRYIANASAVFLPALLRYSSEQFDKTGNFESLRPLWSQLRGYLFGAGARSARYRLIRTMGFSGLLDTESSDVREDAFDLVWAMFDWAVTRKSVRYLSDKDHRLSYNAWIENMIDRDGQPGLFGQKLGAFLKVR